METPKDVEVADTIATVAEKIIKETFKDKLIRYVGGLFMEKKPDGWRISVGRVSWWLAFSPALYIWVDEMGKQDITDHHLTVLLLLAGYNFGKKVIDKIKPTPKPPTDGPG